MSIVILRWSLCLDVRVSSANVIDTSSSSSKWNVISLSLIALEKSIEASCKHSGKGKPVAGR